MVLVLGMALGAGVVVGVGVAEPAGAAAFAAVTARASVGTDGTQAAAGVADQVLTDTTGRLVAFTGTGAYDPADTNGFHDVFVRDRLTGTTTRVSLSDSETQLWGPSQLCGASGDLRYVAFWSNAGNLPGGGNGQIYLRDRAAGTTTLVSVGAGGLPSVMPNGDSGVSYYDRCDVSLDGRYIAFVSAGTGFVADGNDSPDVYRRDRTAATTIRISVADDEGEIDGPSGDPQISDDGSMVVFTSTAPVVSDDTNGMSDVFLRRLSTQSTHTLSRRAGGQMPTRPSVQPAISGNGQVVAFTSYAQDLNPAEPDSSPNPDVHVVLPQVDTLIKTRVSVSSTEVPADEESSLPSLSTDGRFVAFGSAATNLYPLDGNGVADVFVRDRQLGLTALASRRVESAATSATASGEWPSMSGDGTAVAFSSNAPDLVRGDTNGLLDAFVRDTDVGHAPFGSFDALVAQQFADFLGRAPTTVEATEMRQRLRHGEMSPDQVVTTLARGSTWSGHRAPVTRLYWAFFLRTPDKAGLDYWVAQKAGGKGLHTIAGQFAQSQEFTTKYGALSNSAFVTLVYQNVLQRDPYPDEVAYWKGELDAKRTTRGSVMVGFSESAEGRRFLAPQVEVVLVHLGMLKTIPAKVDFGLMVGAIKAGTPLEGIAGALRGTTAYGNRFD